MAERALEELLQSLEGPLRFLRDADEARRGRTSLPIAAWIARLDDLGASAAAPGREPSLTLLREGLAALHERGPAESVLLDEILGLIAAVRDGATGPAVASAARGVVPPAAPAGADRPRRSDRPPGLPVSAAAVPAPVPLPGAAATPETIRRHLDALARPVQSLPGIGPARAAQLAKFGLTTVEDLLYHLPFRYEDRRQRRALDEVAPGEMASLVLCVQHTALRVAGRSGRRLLSVTATDETGRIELVWFNQVRWFEKRMTTGSRWLVYGRVEGGFGALRQIVHPEVEPLGEAEASDGAGILPVYVKPTAMTVMAMRRLIGAALDSLPGPVPEVLPRAVTEKLALPALDEAFRMLHEPPRLADPVELARPEAPLRRALVFDELFFVQIGVLQRRAEVETSPGIAFQAAGILERRLLAGLPFVPTAAQVRVNDEIRNDMARTRPMHRLLQGDVGTGKTLVALQAALRCIECGYQAAIMAPTELLAEQHWRTVESLCGGLEEVARWRLTGDLGARERRAVIADLAAGRPGLVVGTHALVQEGVRFGRLGLAVVDEQHRFGVLQRAALMAGGEGQCRPDLLLMSATPIPRTLALTVYGDLDVATLDQRPPGRKPVATRIVPESQRERVLAELAHEVGQGRQGYVVLPLVEEAENSTLRDATSVGAELAAKFPRLRIAVVHGRMAGDEREAAMRAFRDGRFDVLVATTVIEVGIDVPNATRIVIEHAERFGLSQLHQLRGRVGRGHDAATCVLLTGMAQTREARERLQALESSDDGLAIAEADLAIRGPGALLGTRQSGEPDFRVASLLRDTDLLVAARDAAAAVLKEDPALSGAARQAIKAVLDARQAGRHKLARVG